ncbi:FAD-binding-3 domain-containing protein [Fusarium sp. LHS14.1]|nr:FAD-binding-3 domain-containing protein [Fusarium sp. LHS14.1]
MSLPPTTDVLIVGAGPVGLLIGIGLTQQGVDCVLIEKRERDVQATFGRATTLYPRSLELLEQLDVADDLTQEGFVSRSSINFKDGTRVNERGWNLMFDHFKPSYHDYALNIRQRYSEDVFRNHFESCGKSVWFSWKLTAYAIDTSLGDGYNVTATLEHKTMGKTHVRCKYLVGSDGGSSSVRQLAGIDLDLDPTTHEWIRIDGKMSTDIPDANIGLASIETEHHGNILWVKLDRDTHRVGFALTPSLLAKYPNGITEDEALKEAAEGMKPFKLEVDRLDWWTHYKIKQSVAQVLQKDQFVLLGGDAAHTHSSGFAQGMNTGIHDATNLVWKLAGTIKGWYKPSVLETYASERHAAAKKLIGIDKNAAAVISGEIPAQYQGLGRTADEILWKIFGENIGFNVGLGVTYAKNVINQSPLMTTLASGVRSPDALVCAPGSKVPLRLHDALLRDGRRGCWSIVVFAGNTAFTSSNFPALRETLPTFAERHDGMIRLVTLMTGTVGSAWEALDGPPLGKFFFDRDGSCHSEYGVDTKSGALVVIRPDGIISFATGLDKGSEIKEHFSKFIS